MAMIAGPFTDEIVGILMGQEKEALICGALFYDSADRCCWQDTDGVWFVDTLNGSVLTKVADFVSDKPFFVQKFPEPVKDGFRLTSSDGTVWIPEFTEEEKAFLRNSGYRLVPLTETREKLKEKEGETVPALYPLACKTGVYDCSLLPVLRDILRLRTH